MYRIDIGNATLYCGDCLEVLPELPVASVDLVLTDPPYGTTACKWDTVIPMDRMWTDLHQVGKDCSAYVFTCCQPFTTALGNSNLSELRYAWAWVKNYSTDFLNVKRRPLRAHEDVLVFYRKQPTYNPQYWYSTPYKGKSAASGKRKESECYRPIDDRTTGSEDGRRYPRSVLEIARDTSHHHPTQKPVALMEYMILTYTDPGDVVLDFTMGSGTTGVAAINTGRKFIGIDRDEKYFNIAVNRIEAAMNRISQSSQ
ncbi:MAG: site-specific DNA-methyltransferase [Sphaerochaetaceae bacterium]|nr:site-specific DNA-methyltransferase [Sphaerochaetaceae bacterium]